MNALLIVRLLLAHILGDFLLQTKGMCERKKAVPTWKGWKYQLAHAFIYTAAVYVLVAQWGCWALLLLIGGTHFAVDVAKAFVERQMRAADREKGKAGEENKRLVNRPKLLLFVLDQIFHLSVLAVAYFWLLDGKGMPLDFNLLELGIYALAYLSVLTPTAVFIQNFFSGLDGSKDKKKSTVGGHVHRLFGAHPDRFLHPVRMDGRHRLSVGGKICVSFRRTKKQQRADAHRVHLARHFSEFHGGGGCRLARTPSA